MAEQKKVKIYWPYNGVSAFGIPLQQDKLGMYCEVDPDRAKAEIKRASRYKFVSEAAFKAMLKDAEE